MYIKSAVAMVVVLGNRRQLRCLRLYVSSRVRSAAVGMLNTICESATIWLIL